MPDYCNNTLTIEGDESLVASFIAKVMKDPDNLYSHIYLLDTLHPCPEGLRNTPAVWYADADKQAEQLELEKANMDKYGFKDWYDWCVANWGTKWSDDETILTSREHGHAIFSFVTAYAPPENGFAKVSKDFPELTFILSYMSEGMGYVGSTAFRNGIKNTAGTDRISYEGDEDDYDSLSDYYMTEMDKYEGIVRRGLEEPANV